MTYDPFAPQPLFDSGAGGETAQDPFAPPTPLLPRTPKTANGNIAPTISIEIDFDTNGRIRDIETFSLTDDVQQLADPWSCEIPNVDGERDYLLDYLWFPVTIWVSDPRVQDGREVQWCKGVIVDIEQSAAEGTGTTIKLAGYDKGWYLGSGAPIWKNLQGISIGRLLQMLIRPEYNWGISTATSVYMNNRLRQGRIDAEVAAAKKQLAEQTKAQEVALVQQQAAARAANQPVPTRAEIALQLTPPFFSKPPVIQTEPGEDCGSLLIRYARAMKEGPHLVGMAADGALQLFVPDYKQRPQYSFHNHRPKDERHTRNNVEPGWKFTRSGDQLHNVVECVVSRLLKDGTGLANEANPNEGKEVGVYLDYRTAGPGAVLPGNVAGPPAIGSGRVGFRRGERSGDVNRSEIGNAPLRRLAFNDGERWELAQAKARVKWKWQQELYASLTLTYPVMGISQLGPDGEWRIYCAGTMAEAHDSWNHIERCMFVSRVVFNRSRSGTSSTITLKLPDLLGA